MPQNLRKCMAKPNFTRSYKKEECKETKDHGLDQKRTVLHIGASNSSYTAKKKNKKKNKTKTKKKKGNKAANKSIANTISFSLSARNAQTSCDAHLQQNTQKEKKYICFFFSTPNHISLFLAVVLLSKLRHQFHLTLCYIYHLNPTRAGAHASASSL